MVAERDYDALIGYTGFVGGTLARSRTYSCLFNSKNIDDIRGMEFDTIVCAGVSAVKWLANKEPEADRLGIQKLREAIGQAKARRFVLISTVDVYPEPIGVTETDEPDLEISQPYGKHRRLLEKWIDDHFQDSVIVRLPALFGTGLKKNAIFDLINRNMVEQINPNGCFQWYPMRRFPTDLKTILSSKLKLVNIAVEPVRTWEIVERFFGNIQVGADDLPEAKYDMWTNHPELLGGTGHYHLSRETVMRELEHYLTGSEA